MATSLKFLERKLTKNQKPKIALSSLSLILLPLFLAFDFLESGDYEVIGTVVKLSLGFAMIYSFIKDYRFWRDFNPEPTS